MSQKFVRYPVSSYCCYDILMTRWFFLNKLFFMNLVFIASFLSLLISCAGGSPSFLIFIELLAGSAAIYAAGFALFTLVKIDHLQCKTLVYLITGVLITSLFAYFISTGLDISAGLAFIYFAAFVLFYVFIFHAKKFAASFLFAHDDVFARRDSLIFLGLVAFTVLWCWQIAGSFPSLVNQGVLSTWIDAYYHGAQIAQFADVKSVGQGDIFLSGVSPFLYHRAMYVLPAAIAQAVHLSGLAASTALLLPLGFLLLGAAIYCLGVQFGGRMAGVLAVIFLLILPDNSWLGLQNGFLGFRYIIQVAPGTSYGLTACLISLLFFVVWLQKKSMSAIVVSLFFAVSVYFFRAHFFVLYFPVFAASLLFVICYEKKYFWQIMGLVFLCTFILMYVFAAKNSVVIPFLKLVHLERGATVYTDFYQHIIEWHLPVLTIFTGIILLLGGILGIWTVLYPLLLWMKVRERGWEKIDYIPLILLVCYLHLVLFAPAMYQTFDELQQRPTGLLYAVLIIFSMAYVTRLGLFLKSGNEKVKYSQPLFIAVVILGVILTALYPHNYPLRVLFRGYSLYQDYQMPRDKNIIQAALFLKDKAKAGDIFLTSKDDMDNLNVDTAVVVSSIAGLPSYLGEQRAQTLRAELKRLSIIQYRDSVVRQSIVGASTPEKAFEIMRIHHISWYIALSYPKWDRLGKESVFKSDSVTIYHVV